MRYAECNLAFYGVAAIIQVSLPPLASACLLRCRTPRSSARQLVSSFALSTPIRVLCSFRPTTFRTVARHLWAKYRRPVSQPTVVDLSFKLLKWKLGEVLSIIAVKFQVGRSLELKDEVEDRRKCWLWQQLVALALLLFTTCMCIAPSCQWYGSFVSLKYLKKYTNLSNRIEVFIAVKISFWKNFRFRNFTKILCYEVRFFYFYCNILSTQHYLPRVWSVVVVFFCFCYFCCYTHRNQCQFKYILCACLIKANINKITSHVACHIKCDKLKLCWTRADALNFSLTHGAQPTATY